MKTRKTLRIGIETTICNFSQDLTTFCTCLGSLFEFELKSDGPVDGEKFLRQHGDAGGKDTAGCCKPESQ